MGDSDQRRADFWFHRNRQLDWADQQAATARDLETLRLRDLGADRLGTARSKESSEDKPEQRAELLAEHAAIQRRLEEVAFARSRTRAWADRLSSIDPLRRDSAPEIDAIATEIRSFLANTTDYELGRGSLGTGMTRRDELNLIRSSLVIHSIDVSLQRT